MIEEASLETEGQKDEVEVVTTFVKEKIEQSHRKRTNPFSETLALVETQMAEVAEEERQKELKE